MKFSPLIRAPHGAQSRWQSSTGPVGLFLAMLIAAVFIYRYFPAGFIAGTSSYWLTETDDVTQYIAGFNAYFHSPLKFPLLAFDGFNYPAGTRATFVDIIPIYSLLLKLVLPADTAPFNPFGFWVALTFVLQAVAGWWVLRELNVRSWSTLICGTVLMVCFPALLGRLGHISLMSHWILLMAMALYIRSYRLGRVATVGWCLLLVTGFYVNIYLFVMALVIYLCAVLTSLKGLKGLNLRAIGRASIPFIALALSIFVLLLPMPMGQVSTEWGFGYYSMNLLAPITGGTYVTIPDAAMPGQYEGFNYLGLGVIISLVYAIYHLRQDGWGTLKRHRYLAIFLALFTCYALSNSIYMGTRQIAVISYPDFMTTLTSQFRASGRFFWPVGYTLLIFSLLTLYRRFPGKVLIPVMLVLLCIQVGDLKMQRANFKAGLNRPYTPLLTSSAWDAQTGNGVNKLYFYPKFRCGKFDSLTTLMPVMKYAAMHHIKMNTGYIARHQPPCDEHSLTTEIAGADPASSVFVFVKTEFSDIPSVKRLMPTTDTAQCSDVDFAFVCHLSRQ
ncbi:DUF6311 domain-containing protein [Pseudomonas abietaniphila]|uniref:DUF6311 domain-containing protein n=1 Tax=Pseudomonas abietaniphila TaxID=89065 RepID=UPI003216CE7A